MHYRQPLLLAPRNPLINLGFLELSISIQTSLWIESSNVLCNCLSIKYSFIFSYHIRELLEKSRSVLVISEPNIKFCPCNVCNCLDHKTHSVLGTVKVQIKFLLVYKVSLFIVLVSMAFVISVINEVIGIPLFAIKLIMGVRILWHESLEVLMELINSHRAHSLVFSCSNINSSLL